MDKLKLIAAALSVIVAVALYYYYTEWQPLFRVLILLAGATVGVVLVLTTALGQAAWAFVKSANVERQKVVWPTRREAMQVTLFVIILVIIIGIYLWLLDWVAFQIIYDWILRVTE